MYTDVESESDDDSKDISGASDDSDEDPKYIPGKDTFLSC